MKVKGQQCVINIAYIKLRMEMGNVSKRQQPDHRTLTDNSRRSQIGLQCSGNFPQSEASFSWPLNKYNSSVITDVILNIKLYTRN